MEQSPSWEANRFLARQEIPPFYVTRRFITVVTSARHLSLSWATSPYPTSHFLKIHLKGTCPIQARKIPRTKSHVSFCCLGCTKVSVHVRGLLFVSQNDTFLLLEDVSTSPNPLAGGPPLVGCPWLLIQYIRSYLPYWRPFLHPQPEDAPCRGDRDPLITGESMSINIINKQIKTKKVKFKIKSLISYTQQLIFLCLLNHEGCN